MLGMNALANHIIAIAKSHNLPVTNLQVQKIMFFALGLHIRKVGYIDELAYETYDIPFEKWQYGPVVESIYYRLNYMKDRDITSQTSGKYQEEYNDWDNLIYKLLNINVFELVKLSHKLPSWDNFKDDILSRNYVDPYTIHEIERDFVEWTIENKKNFSLHYLEN